MDQESSTRLKSDKTATFLDFVDDLKSLWYAAGKEGRIVRNKPESEDTVYPTITYKIKNRIPHPAFKELKPRIRETIEHPDIPNEHINIFGQTFQVIVEFNIYSKSAEVADQLVTELEDFILIYLGFLKKRGVREILFLEQGEDETIKESHVQIEKRTLFFDMQFEKITPVAMNEINSFAIKANIKS